MSTKATSAMQAGKTVKPKPTKHAAVRETDEQIKARWRAKLIAQQKTCDEYFREHPDSPSLSSINVVPGDENDLFLEVCRELGKIK
jgi:hypothetical protein